MILSQNIETLSTNGHTHFLVDDMGNEWPISRKSYFQLLAEVVTLDEVLEPINAELADDMAHHFAAVNSGIQMF